MTRFSTFAFVALLVGACVPKAPRRANSAEARHGSPRVGAEQASVEALLQTPAAPAAPPRARKGQVYNAGYWHWDGVRYVRVGGTLEDASPAYLWHSAR